MNDSEFTINTEDMMPKYPRRPRRPLPPGQTRHVYENDPEIPHNFANDEYDEESNGFKSEGDDDYSSDRRNGRNEENDFSPRAKKGFRRKKNASESFNEREASEKNTRPKRKIRHDDEPPRLVQFLMDRRISIWLGIVFIILSGGLLVTLLGYLKTGALDQAVIMNLTPEEIVTSGVTVKSLMGPLGAWLGQVLFAESFGIGAFVVAVYLAVLGWKLITGKKFDFWGLTFRCALLAVAISIVVGLFTYTLGSTTFWGGVHGHYVNKWLLDMTGIPGAIIVSALLIGTLIAVYINELTRFYKKWKALRAQRRMAKEIRLNLSQERVNTPKVESDLKENPLKVNSLETENDVTADIDTAEICTSPVSEPRSFNEEVENNGNLSVEKSASTESAVSENAGDKSTEPVFMIDIPVDEKTKKTGTVAEKNPSEQGDINPRNDLPGFKFPTLDMLTDHPFKATVDTEEQEGNKNRIIKTLGNYNITVESIKATVGPTVTLYEIVPTEGIRIAQIKRLEDDIALSLAAKGIRIIAPMPGKGTVGIEVPNQEPQIVSMRGILASPKFRESKAKLPVALGRTISNDVLVTDLAAMPHALVAGATGQGKSVGLNVLISSLLYRKHPAELKFVLIDPKMVEFSVYEQLRQHYLASLPGEEDAIVTDPSKVLNVLNSLCVEMDNRYALLRKAAVNKIEDYNRKFCQRRLSEEQGHSYLPYIVVIIDEFADLIMTGGKEIEMPVMRITQKARAVGIHMIIATQRPSTNVLTGLIKANCPSRIAFRVLQNVDSRTILDRPGAEQLIGRGDMLYSMGGEMDRVQCAFISSDEIDSICNSIGCQPGFDSPYALPEPTNDNGSTFGSGGLPAGGLDRDPLFDEAARFIVQSTTASTSSLQRRFEIGYNRAGKIMDQMEAAGIVGPASGSKPRSVLIDPVALERILANR